MVDSNCLDCCHFFVGGAGGGMQCFVGVLAMVVVMITMAKVIFALDLKITRVRSLQP